MPLGTSTQLNLKCIPTVKMYKKVMIYLKELPFKFTLMYPFFPVLHVIIYFDVNILGLQLWPVQICYWYWIISWAVVRSQCTKLVWCSSSVMYYTHNNDRFLVTYLNWICESLLRTVCGLLVIRNVLWYYNLFDLH